MPAMNGVSLENGCFREIRENGHAVLLMEANQGERTFSDYPDHDTCLGTIIELYKKSRGIEGSSDDLKYFPNWVDEFYRLEMFIFNKEIARYKRVQRNELKKLFSQ